MPCPDFGLDNEVRIQHVEFTLDSEAVPPVYTVVARYVGVPPLKLPGPVITQASDEDLCVAWQQTADDAADALEPPE